MNNSPVRVLIADSDPLICRGLARLLGGSTEVEIVATSPDRDELPELIGRLQPTVALVDAHMVLPVHAQVTGGLRQHTRATRFVVLGVYEALRDEALRNGACRFLLKDGTRAELVAAIQLAARGECESILGDLGENDSLGG